jgi:hypothetical protein
MKAQLELNKVKLSHLASATLCLSAFNQVAKLLKMVTPKHYKITEKKSHYILQSLVTFSILTLEHAAACSTLYSKCMAVDPESGNSIEMKHFFTAALKNCKYHTEVPLVFNLIQFRFTAVKNSTMQTLIIQCHSVYGTFTVE